MKSFLDAASIRARDSSPTTPLPMDLPVEVLLKILRMSHGTSARLLSRELCALNDSLARRLRFSLGDDRRSERFRPLFLLQSVRSRIARANLPIRVTFAPSELVDDDLVAWLLQQPRLEGLDVSFCPALTSRALAALRAAPPTLAWRVVGSFYEPTPLLSAEQVVLNQLYALRMSDDKGVPKAFAFASPANKTVTGPASNFARMIRFGYSVMLHWVQAYVLELSYPAQPASRAVFAVVLVEDPERVPEAFEWRLDVQEEGSEHEGCWMTSSVLPSRTRHTLEMWIGRGCKRVEDPPWGQHHWSLDPRGVNPDGSVV